MIEAFNQNPALFYLYIYGFLFGKHLIITTFIYYVFANGPFPFWQARKIQSGTRPTIGRYEFMWGFATSAVQAGVIWVLFWMTAHGWTKMYFDIGEYGWPYAIFSLVLMFFWHDAFFYWTHRWMHMRFWYHKVHIVHHRSINPTVFAFGSSHPIEALIEVFFVLPIALVVPFHVGIILAFLVLTEMTGASGHAGVEFVPKGAWDAWWGSWLTTNTHHNLHHQYPNGNYALYGKFWDRYFGTLHDKTGDEFRRVTNAYSESKNAETAAEIVSK